MEPDNVTCVDCRWAHGAPWYYLWKQQDEGPAAATLPTTCSTSIVGQNLDVEGNDVGAVPTASLADCGAKCCASASCAGALFEPKSKVKFGGCEIGDACCFQKSDVSSTKPLNGATGTLVKVTKPPTPPPPPLEHPPIGIRSAPALGGFGAGSFEIRGDGSFREWTIFNQGPAGSGKYGLVDDVIMAARIGDTARVLRTHPPASMADDAVAALNFSGTYPVTRLSVLDLALTQGATVDVYAYSSLKPTDYNASAVPAAVMTMRVENPTDKPVAASFLFSLPAGAWTDCSRVGDGKAGVSSLDSPAGCMHGCGASSTCASWQYTAGTCTLNTDLPESAHATGSHCGVKSAGWNTDGGHALTYAQRPDGVGPNPSAGDFTISGSASAAEQMISAHTGDDLAQIYSDWKNGVPSGLSAGQPQTQLAAHGAISINIVVPPRSSGTASAIFAWFFEDRNYRSGGVDNIYGNYYQHLFKDSAAAAASLASEAALESVVSDINAHHHVRQLRRHFGPFLAYFSVPCHPHTGAV